MSDRSLRSGLGPPCPHCREIGRRNNYGRQDKKFRCVNMSCDVLFYSWQDSVDAEGARLKNEPPPEIESKKEAVQENLFSGARLGDQAVAPSK